MATPHNISRILIANRGEIARRIARTAHARGMTCVGVYSEPDRHAAHLDDMDLAVALGGATAAESYLRTDAIIAAAIATGCDAVHPGYGFLAENAQAARDIERAGLIWIGPTPEQIELLGDKIAAKRAAVAAGVPTTDIFIVGATGDVPDGVPFPALVKAAAGGGGRGMRIVREQNDLAEAVAAASREAKAAFGDATVFIEPYIESGRHIEVQIVGDGDGDVVHFAERDCSVQRRNQKVIEEAPAPGLSDDVRSRLHQGACDLARHVNYRGAGTVEFLVSADGRITFLEVNTRLQVEHPVTEAITGVDLVGVQFDVAMGRGIGMSQSDVRVCGHAVELRVVAEDPASGWLPSTGVIESFKVPNTVRLDSGVQPGSEVSTNYDSLLAKVIAVGDTREESLARAADAMRRADISGLRTNVDMLISVLTEAEFYKGGVDTAYLDRHPEVLSGGRPSESDIEAHLIATVLQRVAAHRAADDKWGFAPAGWRNVATRGQRSTFTELAGPHDKDYSVEYRRLNDLEWEFRIGDHPVADGDGALAPDVRTPHRVRIGFDAVEVDGVRRTVTVRRSNVGTWVCASPAGRTEWAEQPRFADHDAELVGSGPVAPLPGTVIDVKVAAGQRVAEGTVLMVIEAMKMEHQITSPTDAVVVDVKFGVGERVDMGDVLVELEAEALDNG